MIEKKVLRVTDYCGVFISTNPLGYFVFLDLEGKKFKYAHYCREYAKAYSAARAAQLCHPKLIGYSTASTGKVIDVEELDGFFKQVEDKLGLEERTVIHRTQHKGTVVIDPSPFWMHNTTRFEVLTFTIRAAVSFHDAKHKTFMDTFTAYPLSNSVIKFLEVFFEGHTIPVYPPGNIIGAVRMYEGMTKKKVMEFMTKEI